VTSLRSEEITPPIIVWVLKIQISLLIKKNAVSWDVTPCGSCKNRHFGGTYCLRHQDTQKTHVWATAACYNDSFTFLCVDNVRASQETHLYLYIYMMFVPQRKYTHGPPRPVTEIALLFSFLVLYVRIIDLTTALRRSVNIKRFEVFTAVTMNNGVFWDISPCGSCRNRRFG
jgi:hypothetical protein